ncbi:uncharacterized protein B0T23DRAFT_243152 [Neurospora hispaniola]|uniref:Uncharacterized protein n=1 Tax=Neurospora hispaniola TaxID=588809 RepID=A0AAJ0HZM5_9PEZI|nr:hypothetical protein B0T23DRAFT_243152 [Neurospora hispaniola]
MVHRKKEKQRTKWRQTKRKTKRRRPISPEHLPFGRAGNRTQDLSHTGEYAKRTLYQLSHTPSAGKVEMGEGEGDLGSGRAGNRTQDLSHTGQYAKRTLYQLSHTPLFVMMVIICWRCGSDEGFITGVWLVVNIDVRKGGHVIIAGTTEGCMTWVVARWMNFDFFGSCKFVRVWKAAQ